MDEEDGGFVGCAGVDEVQGLSVDGGGDVFEVRDGAEVFGLALASGGEEGAEQDYEVFHFCAGLWMWVIARFDHVSRGIGRVLYSSKSAAGQ